jgi:hypothetical protein
MRCMNSQKITLAIIATLSASIALAHDFKNAHHSRVARKNRRQFSY